MIWNEIFFRWHEYFLKWYVSFDETESEELQKVKLLFCTTWLS